MQYNYDTMHFFMSADMQHTYVNMQDNYGSILLHVDMSKSHLNIIMLHYA